LLGFIALWLVLLAAWVCWLGGSLSLIDGRLAGWTYFLAGCLFPGCSASTSY
jgi:hypothetical protein